MIKNEKTFFIERNKRVIYPLLDALYVTHAYIICIVD